jgi:fructuronate reductase
LPDNGEVIRSAVLGLAAGLNRDLRDWISAKVSFPNSMVDRIVPATTQGDIDTLAAHLGYEDQGLVTTEPFSQWVIEDDFCAPRPDFAALGVNLVSDITPWESAKLRLLNGAHSTLAYLGALAGYSFIHQVIGQADFRGLVNALWDEAATTLPQTKGLDLRAYRTQLLARFDNPSLNHRTSQIAIDGSKKIPQRLVAPLRARLELDQSSPALVLAIAGWIRWQLASDEAGDPFIVDDPLAACSKALVEGLKDPQEIVSALLSLDEVFGDDLGSHAGLRNDLSRTVEGLMMQGSQTTVAGFVATL